MTAPHKSKRAPAERDALFQAKHGRPLPPPHWNYEAMDEYRLKHETIVVYRSCPNVWVVLKTQNGQYEDGIAFPEFARAVAYAHKLAQERSQQ